MNKPLVVITGASSGIGACTAKAFSELGHPLLLLARRLEPMQALNLPNTLCKAVDVTDYAAMESAINAAEAAYGSADCIVNNAGVMLLGLVADQAPAEFQTMLDVNVMGVLNGMRILLSSMIERKGGTVINVSSVAGRKSYGNHAAYCGTKFAVHALTETTREEVAPYNVRCITISPGAVETELLGHTTNEEMKSSYEAWKTDIGGALSAEDIARSICFAYQQPQHVCIREIVIAATRQEP